MKTPRILSVILVIVMITMVVACGQTTTNPTPTEPVNQETPVPGEVNATDEPLATLEISAMLVQYNQPPDPNGEYWTQMQEEYNVEYDIEWVAESAYTEKCSLVLSTADFPDMIQLTSTTDPIIINAMNNGLIMDLTPHLDFVKYPNLGKINPSAWMNSKINGKNYVFPRSRGQYNTSLFIRGDWVEKLGMDTPATIDDLTEYFRGIKTTDVNDNGKTDDIIPLPMEIGTIMSFVQEAFGPGKTRPVFTEDGSGIVNERLTESYVLAVEWLKMLYDEELLASEFALYKTDKNQDMLLAGLGGARHQNAWHRLRLSSEIQKIDPNGYVTPLFTIEGPGGAAVEYDKGFYGGHALNANISDEKRDRILDFFNKTSDPEKYNYFVFGLEGTYYNIVDGFPKLTELGEKEVTNSFYGPYVVATDLYNKIYSPLATAEYNLETREMAEVIDGIALGIGSAPFKIFEIISSNAWSQYWAVNSQDFDAYVADTITGKHTVDELRAYQQKIIDTPEVQTAFKEFKASFEGFGLADWTPTK